MYPLQKADIVMIAPASANVIGKLASGIADDMLTTTFMACTCKNCRSGNEYQHVLQSDSTG